MARRAAGVPPARSRSAARLGTGALWTLLGGNALTELGIGFLLPILPLFLAARGGGSLLVGIVFAAGVVGRSATQYPAGWLSDRCGRRPVILGALLAYALLFPLYAVPMPMDLLVAVRFAHAMAGGAYAPAAMALVADLTPAASRGRAFSQMRASDMVGLTLGPALGGLLAGFRLEYVFVAGGAVCLVAVLLMLRLPAAPGPPTQAAAEAEEQPVRLGRLLWSLLPVIVLGAPIYWTYGVYDTVWSLYMSGRGAGPLAVGLSFATYAVAIALFAGLAAGLSDRLGHLRAGTLALLAYGLLAATYPFIGSVPVLVLIGFVEGALTAAGLPALIAEASRLAPPGGQARTQGAYQMTGNLAQVLGAVVGGAMYGLGPAYAFLAITAACLAGVAGGLALQRRRRP